jgi:hypothetical protein
MFLLLLSDCPCSPLSDANLSQYGLCRKPIFRGALGCHPATMVVPSCFLFMVETRFQPPSSVSLTSFIGIRTRPDAHECSRRTHNPLQSILVPRGHTTLFFVTNSGTLVFFIAPSHRPMIPRVMTLCLSHMIFRG